MENIINTLLTGLNLAMKSKDSKAIKAIIHDLNSLGVSVKIKKHN